MPTKPDLSLMIPTYNARYGTSVETVKDMLDDCYTVRSRKWTASISTRRTAEIMGISRKYLLQVMNDEGIERTWRIWPQKPKSKN